ncbi:GDSL-type esterase/lipase family protein [Zavarzinia sp. CC-PAN008]|uniref:GDSL-type esterase/lipase family protein n=1 Tax=Zavarzinia sp. CC-PAN008 TaxID=3243332 RepID=UPI003F742701
MRAQRSLVLCLALLLLGAGPALAAPVLLENDGALAPLVRALDRLAAGQAPQGVAIVQLGDSHTAGDFLTGRLRQVLARRFGPGGHGLQAPGQPPPAPDDSRPLLNRSNGWTLLEARRGDPGPFGLAALRLETAQAAAWARISAPAPAAAFLLSLATGPGRGTVRVSLDGRFITDVVTAAAQPGGTVVRIAGDRAARALELRVAGDGPIGLLGFAALPRRAGVSLASLGIVGATADLLGRLSPQAVQAELDAVGPALVILAFGTNEGFDDALAAPAYAARFQATLARLRRAVPEAGLLVMGPPDANRLPRGCRRDEALRCVPPGADGTSPATACHWQAPPALGAVRSTQRRASASTGAAFFDWAAAMGGACAMHGWVGAQPPLALRDHVHLRDIGYARIADTLFSALMQAYDGRSRRRPAPG